MLKTNEDIALQRLNFTVGCRSAAKSAEQKQLIWYKKKKFKM